MHHVVRAVRPLSLCLCLLGMALAGCAPDDAPAPTTDTTTTTTPTGTPSGDPTPDPEAPIFVAPGELTVHWTFAGTDLAAACEGHHVTSVRLEVGLDAPAVVDCAAGTRHYANLPAGMYSVGVVLLDAQGAVVDAHYEGVLLRSGASAEVRTEF